MLRKKIRVRKIKAELLRQYVREHRQKILVTLRGFWQLRGWREGGGLSESVKKGKFVTKMFFSDNVV